MKSTNWYFAKIIYFFILVLSISIVQAKPVEDEVTIKNRAKNIAIKHLKKRHTRGINEFKTIRVDIDRYGLRHLRVKQMYKGIPVFGGEAIVHLNENDDLYHVTDQLKKDIAIDVTPSISAKEAIKLAISYYGKLDRKAPGPQANLEVLVHEEVEYLTYRVQINDLESMEPKLPVIFIDAKTGQEIWRYNNLKHTKNRNTYDTNNSSSLPGTLIRTEGSTPSDDSALDAAHEAAGLAHDYYFNVHGRDSFNGSGATITSTVHYNNNYINAFWNGSQLVYGDGDGDTSDPLTVTDIVAHEFTHAVTDNSSNLIYANESGALNEAMSDIFGAAIEAYRDGSVSANTWKIAEEAWTPATAGDALRYMNDPALAGDFDYYPDRYIGSNDNGGVHSNSGIANLAFYLLSEGGLPV